MVVVAGFSQNSTPGWRGSWSWGPSLHCHTATIQAV